MPGLSGLTDIANLYARQGGRNYGEGVTQLEHALQCAALAEADGSTPALIAAALLHDIGHLLEEEDTVVGADGDHRHEIVGARALKHLFGEEMRRPIALHVAAKRYLCLRDVRYFGALSEASLRSLRLQGGPFDAAEAAAFESLPGWREAVILRRFDDTGKCETLCHRSFTDFMPLLRGLLLDGVDA